MSLSYLEMEITRGSLGLKRRISQAWRRADHFKAEFGSVVREVTASPHFRPAALRVTSALAVSFALVRIAKYFLS